MTRRAQVNDTLLELTTGDITRQQVDAIVNAANATLMGGGGVDGAIHSAAGPQLLQATRLLGGCDTGDAKITPGFQLPARYVIHAVGPVYGTGGVEVGRLLASAYRRSLEVALDHQVRTLAFPAISTGVYGYPVEEAAPIALEATISFLQSHDDLALVRFVLFTSTTEAAFAHALADIARANAAVRLVE
jgi:O-acetyl-ADP-ribose deacetylase (regulator of RNase III)